MARGRAAPRRGRKATARDAPPDVFRDMLGDLSRAPPSQTEDNRPVKRRRVGASGPAPKRGSTLKQTETPVRGGRSKEKDAEPVQRSASPESDLQEIDFNPLASSDDTDDSDEFEDVELTSASRGAGTVGEVSGATNEGLTLELVLGDGSTTSKSARIRKRRAVTNISDKKLVVQTHKLHLLCLISHVSLRNHWCNDDRVQRLLRKIVPRRARQEMDDDEAEDQYTRDQKLRGGLRQASKAFKENFTINASGLKRAWWDAPENGMSPPSLDGLDIITSVGDFRSAASTLSGSRDVGAQLFCALLRGLGLEVRLVCSLQPLPLNGGVRPQAPSHTTPDPVKIIRYEETRADMSPPSQISPTPEKSGGDGDSWQASNIRRRLHGSVARATLSPQSQSPRPSVSHPSSAPPRSRESTYPVFWVEVFTPAYQKWISVDALVTDTVAQPSKLEPAQKDIRNTMSYVVGLEEDGSLRDVTRRYTTQFNAKIRKSRLDKLTGSEDSQWWQRVLRIYRHPTRLARDEIEDAEMQRREEREGMPRNIEDFKGHPIYVLERHLRQNEVIHPKQEIGRTGAGKSGDEAVFRRRDVHTVKTADAWYRVGREIKVGEQPLKRHVPKRKTRAASQDSEDDESSETAQGLYSAFQTDLYRAPPVQNGRVPRNVYGNLDVYVPSMIPPGAVHFLHPSTKHAAKLLAVDYVDAVTGFEFKGRNGNPVVQGAVVAVEYKDAVLEVLHAMVREKADAEALSLQLNVLRLWRRFLLGLRINERVAGYAPQDGDGVRRDDMSDGHASDDETVHATTTPDHGAGFFPEATGSDYQDVTPAEGALRISAIDLEVQDFTIIEGPSLETKRNASAVAVADRPMERSKRLKGKPEHETVEDTGGGFVIDDDEPEPSTQNLDGTYDELFEDPAEPSEVAQREVSADLSLNEQDGQPSQDLRLRDELDQTTSTIGPGADLDGRDRGEMSENAAAAGTISLAADDEPESDKGSLLSEDPEDVDADPDWLG